MKITKLKLHEFRNYSELELSFNPQVNLITGKNAQGKTNLIEAIELALSGRSFRYNQPEDLINFNNSKSGAARVNCLVNKQAGEYIVEMKVTATKKEHLVNGKNCSKDALQKTFCVVTFSPESLAAIKHGPQARRELIDDLFYSVLGHKTNVMSEYKKCLQARNRLLKEMSKNSQFADENKEVLQSLNQVFLPLATNLTCARIEIIKAITPRIKSILAALLKQPDVDILVDNVISHKSGITWSQNQVYDNLKSRLNELYKAELGIGQSLIGPHRHEVTFSLNGKDARYFCSQGQQRTIALAIKMAQVFLHKEVHGEFPVLLLDDVFSELDFEKQEALLKFLRDIPAQIFITTAENEKLNTLKQKEITNFIIEKGNVKTGWN